MRHLLFLLVFMSFGCSNEYHQNEPISEKQKIANEITLKVAQRIKLEKELSPCGTGGGMMDQIRMLALSFEYFKPTDIETARELLVYSVDNYLQEINCNQAVQKYLINKPFTSKNLQISIFLRNPDGRNVETGNLAVVNAVDGILNYKINANDRLSLTTIYKETYEEAVQKLKQQKLAQGS